MGELVHLNCSSHVKSLCEGLWRLCRDQFKTDLVLHLNDQASYTFTLHHLILAVLSPKFKHFSQTRFVLDPDLNVSSSDLNLIMEFAYLGKVKVEEERLPRLKAGAQALGIENLVKIIDQYHDKRSKMRKPSKRKLGKPIKISKPSETEDETTSDKKSTQVNEPEATIEEEKGALDLAVEDEEEEDESEAEESSEVEAESDTSEYTPEKKPRTSNKKVANSPVSSEVASPKKKRGRHRLPYPFDEARNQYVCPTCDKGFKRRDNYCRHVRTHDQTAVFTVHKCPQCQFQTTNWTTWKSHLAAVHHLDPQGNVLPKNIKCPQCDFTCVSMFQLKNHNYFKHATKKFTCSECGYSCMRKSEMELHMRGGKHQSDRPFMCDACGNRFQYSYTLKCHMRTHTGEKPYACNICGQSFSLSGTLKSHLLTHDSGRDRPFPCHLCQFASWRRHSLKIHYQHVHKVVFNNNEEFVTWHIQLRTSGQQVM